MSKKDEKQISETIPEEAEEVTSVPVGVLTLLDKLTSESKIKAEVEKQSLEVTHQQNERNFEYEIERLKVQDKVLGREQDRNSMIIQSVNCRWFSFLYCLMFFRLHWKLSDC